MHKMIFKRIVSVVLTTAVLCSICIFPASADETSDAYQKKIDAYQESIDKKKAEIAGKKASISDLQDQIDLMQEQLNAYDAQIAMLDQEIAAKNAVIAEYQADIDRLQSAIKAANTRIEEQTKQIDSTYALLEERLRAAYMSGETSTLEVLLTSGDYETFLTRLELMRRVAKRDKDLVAGLQAEINSLNETKLQLAADQSVQLKKQNAVETERAEIESKRTQVAQVRNTQNNKQASLEDSVQNMNRQIDSNNASIAEIQAAKEREQAKKDAYDEELAKKSSQGSGSLDDMGGSSSIGSYPVSSKGMICPLQYSNLYVSAGWFGYPNHRGIDLVTRGATGNTYGKEIRAAASGKVISAEYHSSWGRNIYIDHGNGVCTRYAHCSKMTVSVGQTVQQGQVIGYVGNTGNVSPAPTAANPHAGAHLHFEVWINGTRVNPAPYFNLP